MLTGLVALSSFSLSFKRTPIDELGVFLRGLRSPLAYEMRSGTPQYLADVYSAHTPNRDDWVPECLARSLVMVAEFMLCVP